MTPLSRACVRSISLKLSLYVVPFVRYSASKNGVTLKLGLGVVQCYWKWRRSIDHNTTYYWSAIVSTKYRCMLYHFQVIWCWIIVTLNRSLKVIQTGTIQKLGCVFLFAFHSNYGSILHHLRDKVRYWSKVVINSYPLAFDALIRGGPHPNIAIPFGVGKLE